MMYNISQILNKTMTSDELFFGHMTSDEIFFDVIDYVNSLPDDIETIVINNKGVEFIPDLSRFTRLKRLDVANNKLTRLPTLYEPLEYLYCWNNLLEYLPEFPKTLKYVSCQHNRLTKLPKLNRLEGLMCPYNELTKLPRLPSTLLSLYCGNNLLSKLPTFNANLMVVNCGNEHSWMNINDGENPNLNKITSLPTLNKNLKFLIVCNNYLNKLPKLNKKLKQLDCSENYLTQLPDLNVEMDFFCQWNPLEIYPLRIRGQHGFMDEHHARPDAITIVNTVNRFRFAYYSAACVKTLIYKRVRRRMNIYKNELLEAQAKMMFSPTRIERLLESGTIDLDGDMFDEDF